MKKILFIITTCILCSCSNNIIYSHFQSFPINGWDKDTAINFNFSIEDTIQPCDILLYVRHTQAYPYQNMWLFIDKQMINNSDTILLGKDTIEFYLADERGRWLGNGYGNIKEMPVLYEQKTLFPNSGQYSITISQGMRENVLKGVSDIGLKIEKSQN